MIYNHINNNKPTLSEASFQARELAETIFKKKCRSIKEKRMERIYKHLGVQASYRNANKPIDREVITMLEYVVRKKRPLQLTFSRRSGKHAVVLGGALHKKGELHFLIFDPVVYAQGPFGSKAIEISNLEASLNGKLTGVYYDFQKDQE